MTGRRLPTSGRKPTRLGGTTLTTPRFEITVKPDEGELWDSPGLVVATAKMMFAAVTGSKPDVGDNAKVDL